MKRGCNEKFVIAIRKLFLIFLLPFLISACTSYPDNIHPVNDFELKRYLGKWYEIARLDHSFERGLDKVTAEYSIREDGGVKVINKGWQASKKKWRQAEGRAYFVRESNEGYLKVSFFGPFYGAYVIFELDKKDYQYAFISGPDKDYLWFLSRTPTVNSELLNRFIKVAGDYGFDTENLIYNENNL